MSGGCKDLRGTYSHNLYLKITGLARRFFPETVLKQDTLLLYNPKECRGTKNLSFLPPWEIQILLSLGTPRLLINLPRKWLSQWCHLHIWGYWYFSQQSWFQLVLLPAQRFSWCTMHKLNKQGDNIQPWRIIFPIWNQSVVPCPVLTVASWPAYRFLKR